MLDRVEQQVPAGASVPPALWRRRLLKAAGFTAGWAVLAVLVGYHLFMTDSRQTVIAGHDATVSPTRDGYATVDLGAFIPDLRYPTGHGLGVDIVVGKTSLDSYQSLLQRYELIGSHPQGEIDKVTRLVTGMLISDAVKGAVIGLAGPLAWLVVGQRRRHELRLGMTRRRVAVGATAAVVAVTLTTSTPFSDPSDDSVVAKDSWESIATFLPETTIPAQARPLEIEAGLMTSGTQSLIESAFRGYNTSVVFYHDLAHQAAKLGPQLRKPRPADTVVLFVADRHDNVGMDPVARAIGDAGGATILFDAGDDTSTGEPWETFSLDSLVDSFSDLHGLYQVPGNHDNGTFVASYLGSHGFTVLSGEPLRTADGIELLGVADPRSSGLGNWRTTSGITFDAQAHKLADVACRSDENGHRVSTPARARRRAWGTRRYGAAASTSCSAATCTPRWAPTASPVSTATSGCPSPTGPPAARRTRSPSAPSCGATPRSPSSPTGPASLSACSRCPSTPPAGSPSTRTTGCGRRCTSSCRRGMSRAS